MNRSVKRVALSALTATVAAVSLTAVSVPQAAAINRVDCGTREDFAKVYGHVAPFGSDRNSCWANGGSEQWSWQNSPVDWMKWLKTGNNVVQWHGDGRWQPNAAIGKWTTYSFPNHPGGVRIDGIRIL
ncbi:beta/gamma crystallin domain-containing protein [Streptomyces sp. NPDC002490]|uniref:beta/gamma crystallin domain-containing protein n=1 Tax=Streptomyces sp. NPDC002490 TaxID=3154416 RepID=UPI00332015D4